MAKYRYKIPQIIEAIEYDSTNNEEILQFLGTTFVEISEDDTIWFRHYGGEEDCVRAGLDMLVKDEYGDIKSEYAEYFYEYYELAE